MSNVDWTDPSSIHKVSELLLDHYGPQGWWPAESDDEMVIGAFLTQRSSWNNVVISISNLKDAGVCTLPLIDAVDFEVLAELIRPSGTFYQKAERLKMFAHAFTEIGGWSRLRKMQFDEAEKWLLAKKGIGLETSSSIMNYALHQPRFVVDAYTWRILGRLNSKLEAVIASAETCYGFKGSANRNRKLQLFVENQFPKNATLLGEFHALLIRHHKEYCHLSKPNCAACPLDVVCDHQLLSAHCND